MRAAPRRRRGDRRDPAADPRLSRPVGRLARLPDARPAPARLRGGARGSSTSAATTRRSTPTTRRSRTIPINAVLRLRDRPAPGAARPVPGRVRHVLGHRRGRPGRAACAGRRRIYSNAGRREQRRARVSARTAATCCSAAASSPSSGASSAKDPRGPERRDEQRRRLRQCLRTAAQGTSSRVRSAYSLDRCSPSRTVKDPRLTARAPRGVRGATRCGTAARCGAHARSAASTAARR